MNILPRLIELVLPEIDPTDQDVKIVSFSNIYVFKVSGTQLPSLIKRVEVDFSDKDKIAVKVFNPKLIRKDPLNHIIRLMYSKGMNPTDMGFILDRDVAFVNRAIRMNFLVQKPK